MRASDDIDDEALARALRAMELPEDGSADDAARTTLVYQAVAVEVALRRLVALILRSLRIPSRLG